MRTLARQRMSPTTTAPDNSGVMACRTGSGTKSERPRCSTSHTWSSVKPTLTVRMMQVLLVAPLPICTKSSLGTVESRAEAQKRRQRGNRKSMQPYCLLSNSGASCNPRCGSTSRDTDLTLPSLSSLGHNPQHSVWICQHHLAHTQEGSRGPRKKMTHRGHAKKVQAAFHHVAGPSTAVLSVWSCQAGARTDMVHLL